MYYHLTYPLSQTDPHIIPIIVGHLHSFMPAGRRLMYLGLVSLPLSHCCAVKAGSHVTRVSGYKSSWKYSFCNSHTSTNFVSICHLCIEVQVIWYTPCVIHDHTSTTCSLSFAQTSSQNSVSIHSTDMLVSLCWRGLSMKAQNLNLILVIENYVKFEKKKIDS